MKPSNLGEVMDEHEAYKIYCEKHNFIGSIPHADDDWDRFYSDIIRLMRDHADVFGRHAVQLLRHAYSEQHLKKRYQKHTIDKTFIPDAVKCLQARHRGIRYRIPLPSP